jgi:hypothetical protein
MSGNRRWFIDDAYWPSSNGRNQKRCPRLSPGDRGMATLGSMNRTLPPQGLKYMQKVLVPFGDFYPEQSNQQPQRARRKQRFPVKSGGLIWHVQSLRVQ